MTGKGGRPRHIFWQFFDEVLVGEKKFAVCKQCDQKVSSRSDRVKKHYVKCSKNAEVQKQRAPEKRLRSPSPTAESPPRKCPATTVRNPVECLT